MTEEQLHCIGCGAAIQSEDQAQPGYTPQAAIKKGLESGQLYCQRCFRLRHYNEVTDVNITDKDFLRLLDNIGNTDSLIVNVVDIFDFNGSLIPGLQRFVGDNPIIKLQDWMRQEANKQGLYPEAVILTSAKKGFAIEQLLRLIDKYRQGRDVQVVGVTNVGKSTLINRIIKQRIGIQDLITTSRFPGTTLDRIEIPFGDGKNMIDTPGIIHKGQMAHYLTGKALKCTSLMGNKPYF